MKGTTQKPCHGCGKTGWRAVDKVCGECSRLIKDGAFYREQLRKDESREFYQMVWRYYVLPRIHLGGHWSDLGDEFQQKFFELLKALSDEVAGVHSSSDHKPLIADADTYKAVVSMRKEVRDLLNECYQLVPKIAEQAYQNGVSAGNSFLVRMAKGEVGIEDYNKATLNISGGKNR